MKLQVKKLNENALVPVYSSEFAAGADLFALEENTVLVAPGETKFIHTGIALAIPRGYVGLIYARSGLACKKDLAPANKVGVIDSDYRGEIMVAIHNHGKETREIASGERIAQIVITPYLTAEFTVSEELDETVRGVGGFGSTGK